MNLEISDDLLNLNNRIDIWKQSRRSKTQRIPKDLQEQGCVFAKRYPKQYLRKVLNISDRWLGKDDTKISADPKSSSTTKTTFMRLGGHVYISIGTTGGRVLLQGGAMFNYFLIFYFSGVLTEDDSLRVLSLTYVSRNFAQLSSLVVPRYLLAG